MSLESNRVDRVRALRKILTQLRGTIFCTSLPHLELSVVTQQTIPDAPKHEVMVQKGGSGAFIAKNSDTTSWHEHLHLFGPFCTEFCKATKLSKMQPNSTKRTKTSVWGLMGWTRYVHCEKFRRDLVARTFALVRPFLHRFL